ncbi:MAG TPA: metal-sensitive transcriptional regulator [Thermotogota bacterium]|nr:metal-sensitive transcriptional regulator [Thermotogota bacterium]HPJ88701.1 metal-sensitive transcriptional regulator [Thermotogota bacterium]HPR95950.1 metal-sensitive transcriptional regulator [Thermotogota bacterium]
MNTENETQKIINRLKKIEGQIRGIQKMVLESRDCSDILIQMSAVKSALKKTNFLILKRYADKCLGNIESADTEAVELFVDTMNEFLTESDYEETIGGADNEKNP